ncbi:tyrosine-tyramine antiporter [Ligilactobacillus sp. LYQ135]
MSKESNKIGFVTFVGIVMAMVATVRSIPTLAAASWQMLFWMIFAVLFFALPVSLMSGELSTMLQDAGGPQLWVKTALGQKWGFVTAWLLWVQMFPGMVMVASTLGPLLGNTIGNTTLGNNHWFTLGCILVIYWIITILNLKFDMAKIGGSIGVWLGVYIPVAVMVVMGVFSFIKVGIQPGTVLGTFSPMKLLPTDTSSLKYVGAIAFIFTGIETAGVYVPRIKDATKNFARGLIVALIGLIFLNIVNAFFVADVVPKGSTELTNITQPILLFCHILGWPTIIANIFSGLAFIGVILQLSAWVTGPSQTIIQVAKEGLVPAKWHFQRENKYGVSKNVVLTQSICISLFALMYALPNINTVFLTLVNTTTLLYCIIYLFIGVSFIKLRYSKADMDRPYRIGKNGNGLAWIMTVMFLFGILLIGIISLVGQPLMNAIIMLIITVVLTIIPLIIDKLKKDQWYTEAQEDIKQQ